MIFVAYHSYEGGANSIIDLLTGVRGRGIRRSSRLQSPPAQPRSSSYSPPPTSWSPNRSVLDTFVARIRYERLRLATLLVPENFHAPIGPGQSQLLGRLYLAKDAPRRVVQAEGNFFAEGLPTLALSASYVKGRLRLVSVRLQSQVSFELRANGVLRSCLTRKQLRATAKIAHLGYA